MSPVSPTVVDFPPAPTGCAPVPAGVVDGLNFDVAVDIHPERPGLARLALRGELDLAAAPRLSLALVELCGLAPVQPTGRRQVVHLDLSALAFMDSAGLGALLQTRDALRAAGWTVHLIGPYGQCMWLLRFAAAYGWLRMG
jgi:anti-anti-sigma factor